MGASPSSTGHSSIFFSSSRNMGSYLIYAVRTQKDLEHKFVLQSRVQVYI